MTPIHTIAVLSDTHGVLPSFVTCELRQMKIDHIIHAGDICHDNVITSLQRLAPTTWVRGNMDSPKMGTASAVAQVGQWNIYILHNLYDLDIDPASANMNAVVHGHLHVPSIEWKDDILFLNPGSCATPRQGHPPSFAIIEITQGKLVPKFIFNR